MEVKTAFELLRLVIREALRDFFILNRVVGPKPPLMGLEVHTPVGFGRILEGEEGGFSLTGGVLIRSLSDFLHSSIILAGGVLDQVGGVLELRGVEGIRVLTDF